MRPADSSTIGYKNYLCEAKDQKINLVGVLNKSIPPSINVKELKKKQRYLEWRLYNPLVSRQWLTWILNGIKKTSKITFSREETRVWLHVQHYTYHLGFLSFIFFPLTKLRGRITFDFRNWFIQYWKRRPFSFYS